VKFDEYARTAVDLVNAQVETLEQLRAFFGPGSWQADEATEKDVAILKRGSKRLREVFEFGSSGRDTDAVETLNNLLDTHPVQPRISGHDSHDWHMHVTGRGSTLGAEHMAGAVWGLAVWLCESGSDRFGVCADERCGNVYLDTSSNCCRRFCSERCATRSHVAAHRARKRAVESDRGVLESSDVAGRDIAESRDVAGRGIAESGDVSGSAPLLEPVTV
jgi:predicted RNA-binding Zn ribbon-like protein